MFSVAIIENPDLDNQIEYYTELQKAINSGSAWSFQGSYGRAMMDAITSGNCLLGTSPARDYLVAALQQVAVLAEYGTTGPGKCKSDALTAEQATNLRLAISDISRAALSKALGE